MQQQRIGDNFKSNFNLFADVQSVTNCSISRIISRRMYEDMEKHSHVKCVEKHLNVTPHWLVIEKPYMKVDQEIFSVVSVVYGKNSKHDHIPIDKYI